MFAWHGTRLVEQTTTAGDVTSWSHLPGQFTPRTQTHSTAGTSERTDRAVSKLATLDRDQLIEFVQRLLDPQPSDTDVEQQAGLIKSSNRFQTPSERLHILGTTKASRPPKLSTVLCPIDLLSCSGP